jgi:hypothetical protein
MKKKWDEFQKDQIQELLCYTHYMVKHNLSIKWKTVNGSQRYKSYLTLVMNKELLLINSIRDQSFILLNCFKTSCV